MWTKNNDTTFTLGMNTDPHLEDMEIDKNDKSKPNGKLYSLSFFLEKKFSAPSLQCFVSKTWFPNFSAETFLYSLSIFIWSFKDVC